MNYSPSGHYYGKTNETVFLDGVILNDADYLLDRVDWHFHENPYFTFLLEGAVVEGNKKQVHECTAGSLLFHNWQDAHYNIGTPEFTRGFHVELSSSWFESLQISIAKIEGSINIGDPKIKCLMYSLFKETKQPGPKNQLTIDVLLAEIFGFLCDSPVKAKGRPGWVEIVREALNSEEKHNLNNLAKLAGIHPVHLSRQFPKYFQSSLGEYLRIIKVQRALALLPDPYLSLTEIAAKCEFADQSHFIRTFKSFYRINPLQYRRLIRRRR